MTAEARILTPVGDLLVRSANSLPITRPYHGVDRLPYLIAPEPAIRVAIGEPLVTDRRLYDALDWWFDNKDAGPPFICARFDALRIFGDLQASGFSLEVLFCEAATRPQSDGPAWRYRDFADNLPDADALVTLGFDVSWPECTHSAIRQPDFIDRNPAWQARLNSWGLLECHKDARSLREEYLRECPGPDLDIFRVHAVDPQTVS